LFPRLKIQVYGFLNQKQFSLIETLEKMPKHLVIE